MKVEKVRVGEKFVLDDRGGVWEKLGAEADGTVRAKCFFGPRDVFRSEIVISPEAYCYVIFEDRPKPFGREAPREVAPVAPLPEGMTGTRIRIVDDHDELVHEIEMPTLAQVAALSSVETIRLTPKGKRRSRSYHVMDFAYDLDENVFYLLVMSERIGGKDEDDGSDRDQVDEPARRDSHVGVEGGGQGR